MMHIYKEVPMSNKKSRAKITNGMSIYTFDIVNVESPFNNPELQELVEF